jgi:hypothetical protein
MGTTIAGATVAKRRIPPNGSGGVFDAARLADIHSRGMNPLRATGENDVERTTGEPGDRQHESAARLGWAPAP